MADNTAVTVSRIGWIAAFAMAIGGWLVGLETLDQALVPKNLGALLMALGSVLSAGGLTKRPSFVRMALGDKRKGDK